MAGGELRINAGGSGILSPETVILPPDFSLAAASDRTG
jgi:hypothetical protein